MPKRLTISPHVTLEELEQRYRQAQTLTERSHYQILWLLAKGKPSEEVAAVTGYRRSWIYELVRSYNQLGVEALGDLRRHNRGAKPKLDEVQQANLLQAIRGSAPEGGLWNGRKVADYLSEVLGQPVSRQQGWKYLKQMELRLRVPRPQHQESDEEEQEAWKKKLKDEVERVQQEYPDADVEIWCEDEHRIGLQPVMRRVWVEAGELSIAGSTGNESGCGYMPLCNRKREKRTGGFYPMSTRTCSIESSKTRADHFKLGHNKRVILPLDQAGWHTTEKLQVPEGIHLIHLPPYSPELQPAERLWPLVNEPLVNQAFDSIKEVEELVYQRCQQLLQQQELIRGLTSYHWLPIDEAA